MYFRQRVAFWHECAYLLPLLWVIALGACATSPGSAVSFRDLCIFDKDQFGVASPERVLSEIKDRYQIVPEKRGDHKVVRYYWSMGKTVRYVDLVDNRLTLVAQSSIERGPKLGQVVATLGEPEALYRDGQVFEGVRFSFFLEYLSQGVTASSSGLSGAGENRPHNGTGQTEVLLSQDLPVTDVDCYVPVRSLDEFLHVIYPDSPAAAEWHKAHRMPWPGFGTWVTIN